jgi:hypothetical protein
MATITKRTLLAELSQARAVWPHIKATLEFKMALWLFAMCIVGLAVLGLTSKFPRGGGAASEHPPPIHVIQQNIASP